jgi:hypothetical protein
MLPVILKPLITPVLKLHTRAPTLKAVALTTFVAGRGLRTVVLTSFVAGRGFLATDPGITPNSTGIPGIAQLASLTGGVDTAVLLLCGIALLLSVAAWTLGSHSHSSRIAGAGKAGVLISLIGCVLTGGVDPLATWASNFGNSL